MMFEIYFFNCPFGGVFDPNLAFHHMQHPEPNGFTMGDVVFLDGQWFECKLRVWPDANKHRFSVGIYGQRFEEEKTS